MSDEKSKTDDNLPAWSVRGVPADIRGAVTAQAKKAGVSTGEWLALAVREKVKSDRQGGRSVVKRETGPVSVSDAGSLIDMISKLSGSGVEIPKGLQRSAVSVLNKLASDVKAGRSDKSSGNADEKGEKEENIPSVP